jgi:hypothetical protein
MSYKNMIKTFSQIRFILIGIFCLLGLAQSLQAQDRIIYHNGVEARGKVIDITDTEVVYVIEKEPETEIYMLDKREIRMIVYEDGTVAELSKAPTEEILIDLKQKNAIKLELPALFFNHLMLTYERNLINRVGLEGSVGIIGIGLAAINKPVNLVDTRSSVDSLGMPTTLGRINITSRERGLAFRFGPKFTFSPQNSLVGWYVKPELTYSRFRANGQRFFIDPTISSTVQDFTWEFEGVSVGVMARVGVQIVRKNRFLFDMNIGFGYTRESDLLSAEGTYTQAQLPARYRSNDDPFFRYSHFVFEGRAYAIGIAAGILL